MNLRNPYVVLWMQIILDHRRHLRLSLSKWTCLCFGNQSVTLLNSTSASSISSSNLLLNSSFLSIFNNERQDPSLAILTTIALLLRLKSHWYFLLVPAVTLARFYLLGWPINTVKIFNIEEAIAESVDSSWQYAGQFEILLYENNDKSLDTCIVVISRG
jgi:hypothetical protein